MRPSNFSLCAALHGSEKRPSSTRAELAKYADGKLLSLQAQYAPTTLRYSRILRWWFEEIKQKSSDPEEERKRRVKNRKRNVRNPDDVYDRHPSAARRINSFTRQPAPGPLAD